MNTATVYVYPSVPMDSIECTIEYDPAVVEAVLHPPNSGQEQATEHDTVPDTFIKELARQLADALRPVVGTECLKAMFPGFSSEAEPTEASSGDEKIL